MNRCWICAVGLGVAVLVAGAKQSEPTTRPAASQPAARAKADGSRGKAATQPASAPSSTESAYAGVSAIEAHPQRFEQSDKDPLLSVPAGTVRDDLTRLAGCWGAFVSPGKGASGDMQADAEFYHFDFATKRMTYQSYQKTKAMGGMKVWLEHVYSFEVTGPDRITARLISMSAKSSMAGVPETKSEAVSDAPQQVLQITVDGDSFKFGRSFDAAPDWSHQHRSFLVLRRFDCPAPFKAPPAP